MLKSFTAHEVEAMRRDAKKRARADGVILAKSLDQVAAEHGYRNWSLLQKNGSIPPDEPQPWLFRRSPEEIAHSMRVVPEPESRYDRRARSEIARDGVQGLDDKLVSPANAVDFAIAYTGGLLAQPRFRLNPKSPAYWEMRLWLPYGAILVEGDAHILVNRYYKPVGSTTKDHVDYVQYPHLILRLTGDGWHSFAHPTAEQPFLYNDGCTPWDNRQDAETYLRRLKELRRRL